jgi:propanediol dehydratase large subunit
MYLQTWNKYLPVIRILLKRSVSGPQQMALSRIDFEAGGSRTRKLACSFNIQLERGRLVALSQSITVKNLLEVLQQDDAVAQLMRQNMYEINLTSSFQLTITNITPVVEAEPEAVLADADEAAVTDLVEADTLEAEAVAAE